MCTIEQYNANVCTHDLIVNRIGIVNQIHGCAYGWGYDNPCNLSYASGVYFCRYFGLDLCTWSLKDSDSVGLAFDVLDALAATLWLVRRAGKLRI